MPGIPYKSKLAPHKAAILAMRKKGVSYRKIADWLAREGVVVTHNAVYSYLRAKSRRQATRPQFTDGLDADLRDALIKQIVALWTHDSTAIEGNTLTLGETIQILEFGLTVDGKPLKDHQEVYGHARAIERVTGLAEKSAIDVADLFDLHRTIMPLSPVDSARPIGNWKQEYNGTTGTVNGKQIYREYAAPHHVPTLMSQWLAQFNTLLSGELDAADTGVGAYCWAHASFVRIHPFFDGNGRMARLLANLPVIRAGLPPIVIPSEKRLQYLKLQWTYQLNLPEVQPGDELTPETPLYQNFETFVRDESQDVRALIAAARDKQAHRNALRDSG